MIRKRMDRDLKWEFQEFPYYQVRVDNELFHGMVCLIRLVSGENCCWEFPKAGRVSVCGEGMIWLQLVPDYTERVVTAMFFPREKQLDGTTYPYSVNAWCVDVTEGREYDPDGVLVFIDKYLDIIFTPQGDVIEDDRKELDAAYDKGELSREQYERALWEGESIRAELCDNFEKTEIWSSKLLAYMNEEIAQGRLLPFEKKQRA